MRVEICRPTELGPSEIDLWHCFQAQNWRLADPFLAPEFAATVDRSRRDVRLAVTYDDGKIVGFLPYTSAPGRLARPVAPGLSDVQAVIHHPECPPDLVELVTRARLIGWSFDHLVSFQVPLRQPFLRCQSWVVDLTGGPASFLEHAKIKRPRNLSEWQRKLRRLEREQGSTEFHFAAASGEILNRLIRLKRAQFQRKGWRDMFGVPWAARVVQELASLRTDALSGTVSALVAGDEVVSAEFGIRSSSVYASWIQAYDLRFGIHSPGSLLWYQLFPRVAQEGVDYVDLGKGLTEAKRRFSTGSIDIAEGFVARQGPIGSCAATAANLAKLGRRQAPGVEKTARRAVQNVRRRRYERRALVGQP